MRTIAPQLKYSLVAITTLTVIVMSSMLVAVAIVSSCSVTITPQIVNPGSSTNFTVRLNNTSSSTIRWIKITRPSSNFTIISVSASGWSSSTSSSTAMLTGSSVDPGTSVNIVVTATTASVEAPSVNWTVDASDDPSGSGPTGCSGSRSATISNGAPPMISSITVSNITSTSVTITWTTNEPATSAVNYGLSDDYSDESDENSDLTLSHSITLTGLLAATGYHYQVISNDGAGSGTYSDDNTFTTASEGSGGGGVPPGGTPPITPPNGTPTPATSKNDKVAPKVSLSTKFAQGQIFKNAPTFKGTATDETALAAIEYSVDGGQNWLPVELSVVLATKKANFSFTPTTYGDGNYDIVVRAVDSGGNVIMTKPLTIVIDRLDPLVGGSLITIGPQILTPGIDNTITAMAGVDQKITLSAVGGATSISLTAKQTVSSKGQAAIGSSFALVQSNDTGLWSGILSFAKPGTYTLTANATDGANNRTSRVISAIHVVPPSKVTDNANKPLEAEVTVYYLEPEANDWLIWDGAAYGKGNPQRTDKKGEFKLFLPVGKYYLSVKAKGQRPLTSNIFATSVSMPLSTSIKMEPAGFKLGSIRIPWINFSNRKVDIKIKEQAAGSKRQIAVAGKNLVNFTLDNTESVSVNSTGLLGRPTDLVITSTWVPGNSEQLTILESIDSNDINIVPVALGENAAKLRAYNAIAGYDIHWLADPDSTLSMPLAIQSMPTHYFIDRKGVIKKVISGVLSRVEIENYLAGL